MNRLNVDIVRTYSLLTQFYTVFAVLFPSPTGRGPGLRDPHEIIQKKHKNDLIWID